MNSVFIRQMSVSSQNRKIGTIIWRIILDSGFWILDSSENHIFRQSLSNTWAHRYPQPADRKMIQQLYITAFQSQIFGINFSGNNRKTVSGIIIPFKFGLNCY